MTRPTRRRYLAAIGAASVVGLAGCSSGDEGENETTDGSDGATETETTSQQRSEEETNQLEVVSSVGEDIESGSIGRVSITVMQASGADDIDLSTTTMTFVYSSDSYGLVFGSYSDDSDAGGEETFDVTEVKDSDGSIGPDGVVLNDPSDRAQLIIDVNSLMGPSRELGEGETATVRINTQSGGSTEVELKVPESLSGSDVVEL